MAKGPVTKQFTPSGSSLSTMSLEGLKGAVVSAPPSHQAFLGRVVTGSQADAMRAAADMGDPTLKPPPPTPLSQPLAVQRPVRPTRQVYAEGVVFRHEKSGKLLTILKACKDDPKKVIVVDRKGKRYKALKSSLLPRR